jgi:hypothetical protein
MTNMSRLVRIERMVVLLAFAVLVVGLMVLVDLRDAARLRSDLRQMVQDAASPPRMRLHSFLLPGRLPRPGNYQLDRPPQPGAQPFKEQNSPDVKQPNLGHAL